MITKYIFLVFTLCFCNLLIAQNSEIRNKQRAIFIYNITQQVDYATNNSSNNFVIGVMGEDSVMNALKKLQEENRTVKGKPLKLLKFNSINDIKAIQLLYVNKNLNYDIKQILKKVYGKSILIVSEGYQFNESMINMININNVFQFEVNLTRLNQENLTAHTSLKQLSINSSDRWQELYQESTRSLLQERKKIATQESIVIEQNSLILKHKELMRKQQKRINEQFEQIDIRNVEVEALQVKINDQESLYQERIITQAKLEKELKENKAEIEIKKKELSALDQRLELQRNLGSKQANQIDSQDQAITQQRSELTYQRNFILLFVILLLFGVMVGFVLWKNYRVKKKLNKILKTKNIAIEAHSKELEEKNEEMEQFAYVASHDLQEPLNSISGLLNLISTDTLDDTGKQGVQLISESTVRMRELIKGLLEYSRLGSKALFTAVDSNKVLRNVKSNLSQALEDSGTTLEIANLPSVMAHEVKLTLLFQNLISNAIKFNKKGIKPIISISAQPIKNKEVWQFEVKDNGIGIAEKNKDKIFLIFQRLHARSEYEGTGIGLAHCKKIIDLHRGTIWVESEVGRGSSFYFTINKG